MDNDDLDLTKPYWVWGRTNKAKKGNFNTLSDLLDFATNIHSEKGAWCYDTGTNAKGEPNQLLIKRNSKNEHWVVLFVYNYDLSQYLPHYKNIKFVEKVCNNEN